MTKAESWASSAAAQAVMQANRGRDTKPELALRKALYSLGMRYRVNHRSPVNPRSTIDVAFPRQRVAVFVDGCFWHGCPVHHRPASTNADYWSGKLTANRARDLDATAKLEAAGWKVLRVWEHDDPEVASMTVEAMVRGSEDGARFTLDALEAGAVESGVAVASWPALHFGPSWNGWATPVVTRAVLADILTTVRGATGEPHRWDGAVAVISGPLDELGGDPKYEDRLEPDARGAYDLGPIGWTWVRVETTVGQPGEVEPHRSG